MKLRLILDFVRRESRGARARLFFFTICLAVGVSAVVGVAGLTDAIEDGIALKSKTLLASDLRVSSSFELPEELDQVLDEIAGAERADVRQLTSMVSIAGGSPRAGGAPSSQLAQIKAVEAGYPFYGELLTSPANLRTALDETNAIVAPDLLIALGLEVGDQLSVGGLPFEIIGEVVSEPDRLTFSMTLGPRVFLSIEGLERTNLVQFGSRVRHRALFALPDQSESDIEALTERLEERLPNVENLRFETRQSSQAQIGEGIRRVEDFLGLVALLSLVLGGIGVAQITRAWIAERTADIAVRRALGFRPREILVLYLAQVLALATVGSFLGAAVGALLPYLAPILAPEFLEDNQLSPWQPGAIITGLSLGLLIALVFAIPPLTAVWRVSPARVLRAEAEPLSAPLSVRIGSQLAVLLGVFGCAFYQARDAIFAGAFTGGLLALALVLALAARLVTALFARLPRHKLSPYLAHGLAALSRPGQGTSVAVVTLGLGVLVVTTLILVDRRLENELESVLPDRAPTTFMVDIQPDQWSGVEQLLLDEKADRVDSVPVVTGRLSAIDGVPIAELAAQADSGDDLQSRRSWALSREQRITWLAELAENNEILEGTLWSDPELNEVSVEEGFAEELGLKIGTVLQFNLQGIPYDLTVTSLRSVVWESFSINFFLVAEPGVFNDAPHFRVATARLEIDDETRVQDRLAASFANVTVLRVREIIEKVSGILRQMAFGVRVLAMFTILVGIAVLAGAVSANGARRAREAALLKALGLTRFQVIKFFAVEYAVVGFVAGAVGTAGAMLAAYQYLYLVLELEPNLSISASLSAVALSALAATVCGLGASTRAILARPIATLHGMNGDTA